MGDACAYRSAPGLYCASPFDFTAAGDDGAEPPPTPFALCTCDRKTSGAGGGSTCEAIQLGMNGTSTLTSCGNKFGCQQSLHPSMLGLAAQRDLRRVRAVPPGQSVLAAQPSLAPEALACRCNSGLALGLDVRSTFCGRYALKYQRRGEPGYFTSSGRFANARGEFDYYAREIFEYVLRDMRAQVDRAPPPGASAGASARAAAQLDADLNAFARPVRELACSVVYPRCAHCHDIFVDPSAVFARQQDHVVCYDPTTCRSLCNSTLRLHESFLPRFVDCVVGGKCKNGSRIWHRQSVRDAVRMSVRRDPGLLCAEESVCQLRSVTGYHAPDTNRDARGGYGAEDPMAESMGWAVFAGITVAVLTALTWLLVRYMTDAWKLTRESGAKGYEDSAGAAARS